MAPVSFGHDSNHVRFLIFRPKSLSQIYVGHPWPRSGISHFSKEPWCPIVGSSTERPLFGYKVFIATGLLLFPHLKGGQS